MYGPIQVYIHRSQVLNYLATHGVVSEVIRYQNIQLLYHGTPVTWCDETGTNYEASYSYAIEELGHEVIISIRTSDSEMPVPGPEMASRQDQVIDPSLP